MSELFADFRERLLKEEQMSPVYREKYEKAVAAMLEPKLSKLGKIGFLASIVVSLGVALYLGQQIIVNQELFISGKISLLALAAIIVGMSYSVAWIVFAGWVIRRGTINMKITNTIHIGSTLYLMAMLSIFFLFISVNLPLSHKILGVQITVSLIPFIIIMAVGITIGFSNQLYVKTKVELLEIKYRLAEIAENLAEKK